MAPVGLAALALEAHLLGHVARRSRKLDQALGASRKAVVRPYLFDGRRFDCGLDQLELLGQDFGDSRVDGVVGGKYPDVHRVGALSDPAAAILGLLK